ncbi:MAG: YebC/PmpR family DNA-binding transcriptional regulator [Deltaproteobacteria bacterium CG11_big_fil_rev_8_21_14_0_20_42_23]|nr:MAG: YebC/PmpR family DNA-binding transcriptional regulator [Deltaproteobacteria bacterium CG11_big_fil_rev_8_21_14_0_20_42_23]PJC64258.1 MAG: YebC/PmpR family DNA-binding transcriptional regulator [Deltaproteobacteria bacterium CG_4_9_14_0_2_um_filter_42_21]
MSGHSKWSTIKHKKGAADAKRGKLWSKIIKEITIAARDVGGDVNSNPRLRGIVDKAKAANMPNENIDRAIKRGTGELEGVNYEEISFEGYGPGGAALFIETVSDNRNRTVSEIRHLLTKGGGNLGENGCVAWMFERKGQITFNAKEVNEDTLMEVALDAGAEDIVNEDELFVVTTDPTSLHDVKSACEAKGLKATETELQMIPTNTVALDDAQAEKMLKLMDALEEHDDVQNVYSNFDIDPAVMEKIL